MRRFAWEREPSAQELRHFSNLDFRRAYSFQDCHPACCKTLSSRSVSHFCGKAKVLPLETRPQFVDDLPHVPIHKSQEIQQGSRFGHSGFVKRYIEGKAHILIRFRGRDSQEFLAYLQRDGRSGGRADNSMGQRKVLQRPESVESGDDWVERLSFAWGRGTANWCENRSGQHTVFIDDVEVVKLPEPMAIPVLVWLEMSNFVEARLPHALYASWSQCTKVCGRIKDWELGVSDLPTDRLGDGMGQMIERAAEVMERVSKYQGDIERNAGNFEHEIDFVTGLVVLLNSDKVLIGIPEGIDSGFQIVDVLLGPLVFL